MNRRGNTLPCRLLGLAAALWMGLHGPAAVAQTISLTKVVSNEPLSAARLRALLPSWSKLGPAARRQIRRMVRMEGAKICEGYFSSTPLGLDRAPCIGAYTPDGQLRALVSPTGSGSGTLAISARVVDGQLRGAMTIVGDGAGSLLRPEVPLFLRQSVLARATVAGSTVVRLYASATLGEQAKVRQGLPADAPVLGQEMIYTKRAGPRPTSSETFAVFRSGVVDVVPGHDRYGRARNYATYQTWEGDLFHERPDGELKHVPRAARVP